jgi:hypothetical protein
MKINKKESRQKSTRANIIKYNKIIGSIKKKIEMMLLLIIEYY